MAVASPDDPAADELPAGERVQISWRAVALVTPPGCERCGCGGGPGRGCRAGLVRVSCGIGVARQPRQDAAVARPARFRPIAAKSTPDEGKEVQIDEARASRGNPSRDRRPNRSAKVRAVGIDPRTRGAGPGTQPLAGAAGASTAPYSQWSRFP